MTQQLEILVYELINERVKKPIFALNTTPDKNGSSSAIASLVIAEFENILL